MAESQRYEFAQHWFVTCPKGLEFLLADELSAFGAQQVKQTVAGVSCQGDLSLGYRICLESRLGSRVLMPLLDAPVHTAEELYAAVQSIAWIDYLRPSGSLSVDFNGQTAAINNTHFGALKVKDAIVDQLRDLTGQRPSVERQNPELRINVHLAKGRGVIALDMSGESLHRRGYRLKAGAAPIKENLAAAVLLRAGWPAQSEQLECLVDPMCGSGTLLIEAAMMAADIAPGLLRQQFGFSRWIQHDRTLWQSILAEAKARAEAGKAAFRWRLWGSDQDAEVLKRARENAQRAGVAQWIDWQEIPLAQLKNPGASGKGLLITNPPYGERLGDTQHLMFLYRQLGHLLKQEFAGWQAGVLTSNPDLCKVMGLKSHKSYALYNGALESRLFLFDVFAERVQDAETASEVKTPVVLSETVQMLVNRLQKNRKNLSRWLKKSEIECYRLYDADIPEYAVAIDVYADQVIVQEYQAPAHIDQIKAFSRLSDVVLAVSEVLGIPTDEVVLKRRKRQQGTDQYERQDHTENFRTVQEHGCRLQVNLQDYLDTGLFLDHRPVRLKIQQLAQGKEVLNLFCYTASASVHAARGGALSTTSVDMSATYLDWAKRNFQLNQFDLKAHKFIREDCLKWLKRQTAASYDLIFMDPPTFSNSKRMEGVLDVQRDHVELIEDAMRLLRKDGLLIFSNNNRRFKMDYDALAKFEIRDITPSTLDPDFKRNPRIHSCFEIRYRGN
ncbi:bifunctional 23S rRNA (guanine(2069)-N(7))-methyltransferase RlmK/23S rRNA (guanine(2445)-N(2))-methyltransferase RlmL [Nitrincola tapanii]|uniref:Ribosomal RNA large subunit methyltransferase K/L n=1 Tax=Nitrincola tapanii TaxID=1708751 RepID=A0A5A9W6D4_9GAMM|nr:bifunctional 23S rRNA (guanine(2069)-N(7))-methyltransferase RlmK/23S rRNA (guanine(2445)-N(2))-methyltransferase RlmL [Nitrincola tapanii]KAA0875765.1 bifunctional 23S rRNA (guanine(2069)-N(7))-methyltransferase RlmK/23S rRNA (guanine(2445)-N(2))-methyltransferase RlmL [Nitrincola tapanii]